MPKIVVTGTPLTAKRRQQIKDQTKFDPTNNRSLLMMVQRLKDITIELNREKFKQISAENQYVLRLIFEAIQAAEQRPGGIVDLFHNHASYGDFVTGVIACWNKSTLDFAFDPDVENGVRTQVSAARDKIKNALYNGNNPKAASKMEEIKPIFTDLAKGVAELCHAIDENCDPRLAVVPPHPNAGAVPVVRFLEVKTQQPIPPRLGKLPIPPLPVNPRTPGEYALIRREKQASRRGTPLEEAATGNHDFSSEKAAARGQDKTNRLGNEANLTEAQYQTKRPRTGLKAKDAARDYTVPQQALNLKSLQVHQNFEYKDTGRASEGEKVIECVLNVPGSSPRKAFDIQKEKKTIGTTTRDEIVILPTKEALTLITTANAKDITDPLQAGGAAQLTEQIFQTGVQAKAFVAEVDLPGFDPADGITTEQAKQLVVCLDAVLTAHMLPDISDELLKSVTDSFSLMKDEYEAAQEAIENRNPNSITPPEKAAIAKTRGELASMWAVIEATKKAKLGCSNADLYKLKGDQYVKRVEEALKTRELSNVPFGERVKKTGHIRPPPT